MTSTYVLDTQKTFFSNEYILKKISAFWICECHTNIVSVYIQAIK